MATGAGSSAAVTGGKRRYRTKLERRKIVEEVLVTGAKTSTVAKAHGVRASQVNQWRRLYKQGLLESRADSTALVPVRILEAERACDSTRVAEPLVERRPTMGRVSAGTIHLTLERAHLQIEGAADPCSLRLVLQHLLR
jgi:transposase-like protein